MKLVAAKCPSCGSDIRVNSKYSSTRCSFCNSEILVDDAVAKYKITIDNNHQFLNYLKLGKRYYDSGEYIDAYEMYDNAIKLDPDNALCVLRYGICKALKSCYTNFDVNGIVRAFNIAIMLDNNLIVQQTLKQETFAALRKIENVANNELIKKDKLTYNDVTIYREKIYSLINAYEILLGLTKEQGLVEIIIQRILLSIKILKKPLVYVYTVNYKFVKKKFNMDKNEHQNLYNKEIYYRNYLQQLNPSLLDMIN